MKKGTIYHFQNNKLLPLKAKQNQSKPAADGPFILCSSSLLIARSSLPKLSAARTGDYIAFKLPTFFPYTASQLRFEYRLHQNGKEAQIFAMEKKSWEELPPDLRENISCLPLLARQKHPKEQDFICIFQYNERLEIACFRQGLLNKYKVISPYQLKKELETENVPIDLYAEDQNYFKSYLDDDSFVFPLKELFNGKKVPLLFKQRKKSVLTKITKRHILLLALLNISLIFSLSSLSLFSLQEKNRQLERTVSKLIKKQSQIQTLKNEIRAIELQLDSGKSSENYLRNLAALLCKQLQPDLHLQELTLQEREFSLIVEGRDLMLLMEKWSKNAGWKNIRIDQIQLSEEGKEKARVQGELK